MTLDGDGVAVGRLTVGVEDFEGDVCGLVGAVGELGGDGDVTVVARGDIEGMALEIEVSRCGDEADVSEESATCIPTGVAWLTGIGNDLDEVVFAGSRVSAMTSMRLSSPYFRRSLRSISKPT